MRIVRLEPPKGRWAHQRVTLEDGTKLQVRPDDVAALDVVEGDLVDESVLEVLRLRDAVTGARAFAARLLAIRPRSRHELLFRLEARHVPPAAVTELLAEFERDGLIDDARFARSWIDSRMAHRPSGAVRLRAELRRKGVDRHTIEDALKSRLGAGEEAAHALSVARALARRYRPLDHKTAYRRLAGALERRGFSTHVIVDTLAQVLGAPSDPVNA